MRKPIDVSADPTRPCEHCGLDRIMRGREVYEWQLTEPDRSQGDTVDLHAQCVGPWMLARDRAFFVQVIEGDPTQLDIESSGDEEEEEA